jgi:hypothetical protein
MMAGAGGAMRATGWRATAIRFQQFGEVLKWSDSVLRIPAAGKTAIVCTVDHGVVRRACDASLSLNARDPLAGDPDGKIPRDPERLETGL